MFTLRARPVLVLVIALVAWLVGPAVMRSAPALAATAPTCASERPDQASAAAMAKACHARVEVLAGRNEYTQVFANPDGTSTFESSAVPARVHRADNSWAPVDTTLRARADGWLVPTASTVDVAFSSGGSGPFVSYRDGDSLLTLSLPMSLPRPRLVGSSAVYPDVVPGVDLRVTASATGFRHVLVVKTPAAAARQDLAAIRVVVGGDALAKPTGDGRLRFVGRSGRTIALTQTASMWDSAVRPGANGEVTPAASPAFLQSLAAQPPAALVSTENAAGETARTAGIGVVADRDGHGFVLTPDAGLLRGADAVFPLFIDPSIAPPDTKWAYSRSTDANYTMDGKAWIGKNPPCCGGDGSLFRAFFDFPTTSNNVTYKGKKIISAKFNIELYHSYSCTPTVANAYRTSAINVSNAARMSWASHPLGSGVTFLGSASGNANKAGGCGTTQPDMLMTFGNNAAMKADVQLAADGNWGTYTIGLCACDSDGTDESTQDRWKRFYVDTRTTLSVTFDTVPGTPANLSPHQGQVACGGIVGTSSPVLQAQYVDADGSDTLSATFRWQQLPSGTVTTVAGPSKPANNNGTVTLNLGTGAEGRQYQFQVQTNDGLYASVWSPWCSFTVDTTGPPAPIVTPVSSGSAPVYAACDPGNINGCSARGGPGIAGAFTIGEPTGTAGQDVVRYVYGWDSPGTTVTVSAGGATAPILLTPPHYGLNKVTAYAVDGTGHTSPTTVFTVLVAGPSAAVASWPLDSIDSHGYTDMVSGGALTASGVTWTNDIRYLGAQGASFNGTGDARQAVPAFDTSGSFSVSAWVNPSAGSCTGNHTVVSMDADSLAANNHASAFTLNLDCDSMRWTMDVSDQNSATPTHLSAVSANASAVPGRWTFLVGVFDESANQVQLWVDGALVQTTTASSAWISSHGAGWRATGPVVLGRYQWNNAAGGRLNGAIADVRLWNRVIVADDIAGTDANPIAGVPAQPGLTAPLQVGAWLFDEGECFCASVTDRSVFARPLTVSPNWTIDPNWNNDPATTPAWLTADSHDGDGGLRLDGVHGYASTSDDAGTLDPADDVAHPVLRTDQSLTVSVWVKLAATNGLDQVVLRQGSPSAIKLFLHGPDSKWAFTVNTPDGAGGYTGATVLSDVAAAVGSWVNLVGEFDAGLGQTRLYVNGDLQADRGSGARGWNSTGSLIVGSTIGGDYVNGTVDDAVVWQGLLNQREIHDLYGTSPAVGFSNDVGERVAAGDVDGDGKADTVTAVVNSDGTFSLYVFQFGSPFVGVWLTAGSPNLGAVAGRFVVADFTADGKADAALVADNGDGTMTIWRWASTGSSFANAVTYRSGAFDLRNVNDRVAAGDVDGDGAADLVMTYQNSDSSFSYYVFKNGINAPTIFYTSGTFGLGPVGNRMVVADFTGDHKAEPVLVYQQSDGTMKIWRWTSTGTTFTNYATYISGSFNLNNVGDRVGAGDVDGDGIADVLLAYQNGDGTFGFWSFKSAVSGASLRYTSGTFSLVPVAGRMVVGDFVGDPLAEPAFVSKEGTSLFTYRWTNNVVSFADFTSYQLG